MFLHSASHRASGHTRAFVTSVFTELSGCDCGELRVLSHFSRSPKVTFLSCFGCCWPFPLQPVHFGHPLGQHLPPGSSLFLYYSERTPDISVKQSSAGLCMPAESRSSPALFIAMETGFLSYVAMAITHYVDWAGLECRDPPASASENWC